MKNHFASLMMLASLAFAISAHGASSKTIISCVGPEGYAQYSPVSKAEPWVQDRLTGGRVSLELDESSGADIVWTSGDGQPYSSRDNGAQVITLQAGDRFVTVLVAYPEVTSELYTFDLAGRRAFWSQHRFGRMADKMASLSAPCD